MVSWAPARSGHPTSAEAVGVTPARDYVAPATRDHGTPATTAHVKPVIEFARDYTTAELEMYFGRLFKLGDVDGDGVRFFTRPLVYETCFVIVK